MIIRKLELSNFRNYEKLTTSFNEGINYIHGDNGSGTGEIRNELDAAGSNQQSITDGIADVEGTADSIAGSIDQSETAISGAAGTVTKLEDNNKTAGQLIAECQQIINGIRARDEGKTAKPWTAKEQ